LIRRDRVEFEVRAVKKGFLWFKKVHFEVSYGDNPRVTDFCYSLGDLALKLINMGAEKYDI
jgi:hypothetical protein